MMYWNGNMMEMLVNGEILGICLKMLSKLW